MSASNKLNPIPKSHSLQALPNAGSGPLVGGVAGGDEAGIASQITPAFVWWVFQEWWKLVVPAGVIATAMAGATVAYLHVPRYEAKAMLTIEDTSPYIAFALSSATDSRRFVETQQQLIRSDIVLEPVLGMPRIASIAELMNSPDRAETMRKNLWVKPLGNSSLYNITYTSPSAADAAAIVNAVAEQYINYYADEEAKLTQNVISLLEEEAKRHSAEVVRLRRKLVALAEEARGADPFSGSISDAKRAVNPIGSIVQSLTEMDLEREMLKAQREFLQDSLEAATDPKVAPSTLKMDVENHPETTKREELILAIKNQMEDVVNFAKRTQKNPQWENNREYIALKRELEQRTADLAEFRETLKKMILAHRTEERKVTCEKEIAKIDNQLTLLETQVKVLEGRFNEQVKQIKTGEGMAVELEFARDELNREEKVLEMIASRKLALQTETRAPRRVILRQAANVPMVPLEPLPYKVLMLACTTAFFVPFGLVFLKELLVRRVSDVEQLARETRLRVLGEIAELPVRSVAMSPRKISGRLQREAHIFAESINSLRTNLSLAEDLREKRVLVMTSAVAGESKSSVATSLAMSFANSSGRPTLVIDGDMRSPDVASMLKTKSQPGLFEVLAGKCQVEECIQRVADSQLYVLAAGKADRTAHHHLTVKSIETVVSRLRPKFQTILIDTPPVLGASEAVVLAKAADAALVCALAGVSRVKQVQMAVDRLEHAGVNVAGAVLSGSSVRRYAYKYGYYPLESAGA